MTSCLNLSWINICAPKPTLTYFNYFRFSFLLRSIENFCAELIESKTDFSRKARHDILKMFMQILVEKKESLACLIDKL